MKDFTSFAAEGREETLSAYRENEVVRNIISREQIFQDSMDTISSDQLSLMAVELASLKTSLGVIVSSKAFYYNKAYVYRKLRFSSEYKALRASLDKKLGDAKEIATLAIEEDMQREITMQYEADLYKTLHDDTGDLIRTIQSRLKDLRSEEVESRYP